MEFVRVKYANNKLITADVKEQIKEHREIIEEYVEKKGCEYLGFVPIVFGPSGRVMEGDLIFKKKVDDKPETNPTLEKRA